MRQRARQSPGEGGSAMFRSRFQRAWIAHPRRPCADAVRPSGCRRRSAGKAKDAASDEDVPDERPEQASRGKRSPSEVGVPRMSRWRHASCGEGGLCVTWARSAAPSGERLCPAPPAQGLTAVPNLPGEVWGPGQERCARCVASKQRLPCAGRERAVRRRDGGCDRPDGVHGRSPSVPLCSRGAMAGVLYCTRQGFFQGRRQGEQSRAARIMRS